MLKFISIVFIFGLFSAGSFAQWSQLSFSSIYIRDIFDSNGEIYVSTAGSGAC